MPAPTRRDVLALLLAAPAAARAFAQASEFDNTAPWLPLFDGKTLNGWKAPVHPDSFKVVDGQIVAQGPYAHLYYTGPVNNADFKNFELSLEVLTRPGADSWILFHTAFQPSGLLANGLRVKIANGRLNSWLGGSYPRTGSLLPYRIVYKQLVPDNEWFRLNILVRGKQVRVRVNDMLVVDYIEPDKPFETDLGFMGTLGHGRLALQTNFAPDPICFKNIRVRPRPDIVPPLSDERPEVDDLYREIVRLENDNYPVVDYHVHLKGGLTLDQALSNSRRLGIFYGIAINCGLNFPVHDDASVRDYLATMKDQPCYVALQGEGREWMTLTSPESVARFDYCFTDAMTFRDSTGYRRRLWIKEEMGDLSDPESFMEMYVSRIEGVMREPIDIYANPTFLPEPIRPQYDALWTPARMKRVIDAAIQNDVAIEINNRYRIPSPAFLKAANAAGAKFSFGTNNAEAELGRLEYSIQMVKECGIRWDDIFVPKPDGKKPIQIKKWRTTLS